MSSKKRSAPLDNPPSASSSDDDDDSASESDDDQQPQQQQRNFSQPSDSEEEDDESEDEPLQNPNTQNPNQSESEEEEDESASDDEETQTPVKNSFTKPKTLSLTPPSSSFDNSDIVSPSASDFAIKPSKKITPTKKIKLTHLEDDKKLGNKRVWTDGDEIMLLEGYLEYFSDKGCSPLSDLDDFYKFMMDSLPGNATKSQLYEKIRRLKKKFRVNVEKVEKGEPVFAKAHDGELFEVSKRIWGDEGCEDGKRAKPKARSRPVKEMDVEEDEVEVVVEEKDFETLYPYWNAGLVSEVSSSLKFPAGVVELVKDNLSLIGEGKAKQMDEKWKLLFENETLLRRKRIALLSEVEIAEG
ncbi:storekeeper protein [Tanacetum coccineum]